MQVVMDTIGTSIADVDVTTSASVSKGPGVSWWEHPAPRLQASDSELHISSVIAANFGLGVDMSLYLSPARIVMDELTSEERDNYKAKGSSNLKIAASWKRWKAMNRLQQTKFVNVLYSLSAFHAKKISDFIAAEMVTSATQIDEEVSKNRTMHEMARAMHVITDTDNIAALSKALGRYNRLELDRAHSKLDAEIEVTTIHITLT
jgi:hypothetical protein